MSSFVIVHIGELNLRTYKLSLIAYNDPAQWVLNITYLDRNGTVTKRAVSPVGYQGQESLLAICLGRLEVRRFRFARIMRAQLQLTADVLAPEQIEELVSHKKRTRRV